MTKASPLILYVITDLELGGVPLHLSRLAPALRDRGFRVVVASLAPIGPVGRVLNEHAIEVRSCNGCCGLDFRIISKLSEIIEELRPSLIHSLLFHANQAARIAAMLNGFPADRIICEIQTVEVERRWHLWVDRFAHRLSRLTIGNSPSVIEHLHLAAGIPYDRLRLVRGGIDFDRINGAQPAGRTALGLKDSDRILIWVGRLDPVKGLDHLLHALPEILQQFELKLMLVGDGPERRRLESLTADLRLQDTVHFLGPRNDVPSLLKTADIFAFPSRTEGLPNALLEAMAAGRPIVTTDVAGCRDLIANEQTGLVVPFGDTHALANAVIRLLENPNLALRLGKNAQLAAAGRWNIQSTWRSYEEIYRQSLMDAQNLPNPVIRIA